MKPKPIPERGELVALLENCTTRQVCVHYGVTAPTLYNWIAKLSIERKKKQPNARNQPPEARKG